MKPLKWIKNLLEHLTEEPSASIVDEATSEKTIMATQTSALEQVRDWAIEKIETTEDQSNALALVSEFKEWIDVEENQQIDYLCLEDDGWTDQEIDVR
jgi:hypothetical protein